MVAERRQFVNGKPDRKTAPPYLPLHAGGLDADGVALRLSCVSAEQRMGTDARRFLPARHRFAGDGCVYDWRPAHPAFRTKLCLPLRDDCLLHRRFFVSRPGNGPDAASPEHPVPAAPLFPDLCRSGTERTGAVLQLERIRLARRFPAPAFAYRQKPEERPVVFQIYSLKNKESNS